MSSLPPRPNFDPALPKHATSEKRYPPRVSPPERYSRDNRYPPRSPPVSRPPRDTYLPPTDRYIPSPTRDTYPLPSRDAWTPNNRYRERPRDDRDGYNDRFPGPARQAREYRPAPTRRRPPPRDDDWRTRDESRTFRPRPDFRRNAERYDHDRDHSRRRDSRSPSRYPAPRRSDSPPPRPLLRGNSPGPSTYPTSRNYSPSPVRNITELDSPRTTSSHRSVLRGKEHHGRSDHGTPSRTSSPTRSRRERSRSQGSTKAEDESQDVTRSISHPPRSPLEKQPDTLPPLRDPSPPGAASSKSPLYARPSSPTIVQEEVHLEQQIPMEQREEELPSWLNTSRDKGKSKEEPETTEDIEMRAEIPHSPASNPRELEQVPRRRSRSPPTGPRHYLNIPTGPAFAQHISPVNSNESVQSPQLNSLATWTQTRMDVDPSPKAEASQSQVTHPPYEPKPYPAKQFEPEIARLETLCQATMADYAQSGHEVRRARHELEMATIDFRAAELRREIADAQVEQARLGTLGIDARSERISSPVPASA